MQKRICHPYTHNLLKLVEECDIVDLLSEDQKKLIDLLMPLNIEARYPDEKREIMKNLTSSKTREIFKSWCR